jgi:gliding motility-associated-like protein
MNIKKDMEYRIFNREFSCAILVLVSLLMPFQNFALAEKIDISFGALLNLKSSSTVKHFDSKNSVEFKVQPNGLSANNKFYAPPPPPAPISALPDSAYVNGYAGNANLLNIFLNDSFNNLAIVGSAMKVTSSIPNGKILLDTATGNISVMAGIAAGTYVISYSICDTSDLSNCASSFATIYVSAPPIVANSEFAVVDGLAGNTSVFNVFSNDSINGNLANASSVNTSIVTGSGNAGISLNLSTGVLSVASLTPAGIYTINYKICDTLNASNCDTALITILVSTPVIVANPDASDVNGYNGAVNLLNVLDNDSFYLSMATLGRVNLSVVTPASSSKITLNISTGNVSIDPFLRAGLYSIVYRICDSLNPSNCDTSIVYITVNAPLIVANPDYVAINGYVGAINILNIYANDSINSILPTSSRVTLTVLTSPSEPGIILNTITGRISIFPYTPAGVYTYEYRICDTLNTSNCDTSLVTIHVLAPPIIANNDDAIVNGYTGANNIISVLANDSINNTRATLTNVFLSLNSAASHPNLSLNLSTGMISIAPKTPAGVYALEYKICDTLNPLSCDTGIVTVIVTAPIIKAKDDFANVNGYNGNMSLLNVFANDSLNGTAINIGAIKLTIYAAPTNSRISLDTTTGIVGVSAPIMAGLYTFKYMLIDTLNPSNFDTAEVSINVTSPIILARTDNGVVNGAIGNTSLLNVLANDSLNGLGVSLGMVSLLQTTSTTVTGISLDTATGVVSVLPNIPAGVYSFEYRICDTLNTGNCDTSMVYITVLAPPIIAVADTANLNGYAGSSGKFNVLANDSLNQIPISIGAVTISIIAGSGNAGVNLNVSTGFIEVNPRMSIGNYAIRYRICDTLNPGNCDSALVIIKILAAPVDAVNDTIIVNGYTGNLSAATVWLNDSINNGGIRFREVLISVLAPSLNSGIILDTATGVISVQPRTKAGLYTINYKICDTLNRSNCDSATARIEVLPPSIIASADNASVNSFTGDTSLLNVLANDSLNGMLVNPFEVRISVLAQAGHAGITLNDTTGIIRVAPRVPAGLYTISYKICDTLNKNNCDSTIDSIRVKSPIIVATNDTGNVFNYNGIDSLLNVLTNDSLNATTISIGSVKITTLIAASSSKIKLNDTTGVVSVGAAIPSGVYAIKYKIADTLNIGNEDTAWVYIKINAPPIFANSDKVSVDGYAGNLNLLNVVLNDSIAGAPTAVGRVFISTVTSASSSNIILNTSNGQLIVLPNTLAGTYSLIYKICDTLNPANCDTALVTINVLGPSIILKNDTASVNSYLGSTNLINIYTNDSFGGVTLVATKIKMKVLAPFGNSLLTIDTLTGWVSAGKIIPKGLYSMQYSVCDTLNTSNCDTAEVFIYVDAPKILAQDDSAGVNGFFGSANIISVLGNDSINGLLATSTNVAINLITPSGNGSVVLDTLTGLVSVAPGTPAGTYFITYSIADTFNTSNRDTALVKIEVYFGLISTLRDSANVNGYLGQANLISVLINDSLNGSVASSFLSRISTVVMPSTSNIVLDTATGFISVKSKTAAGIYMMAYTLQDTTYTLLSDTTWIIIVVDAFGPIGFNDDTVTANRTPVSVSVLNNDFDIDGNINKASLKIIQQGLHGVTVADTILGTLTYTPDSAWNGADTVYYSVCDSGMVPILCTNAYLIINTYPQLMVQDTFITNVICFGDSTGTIKINVVGGLAPYTISWNTIPIQIGSTARNLKAGLYTATITDSLKTQINAKIAVKDSLAAISVLVFAFDPKCNGNTDGAINLTVTGGATPYSYLWSNGSILKNQDKLAAGKYTVIVTDTNNCKTQKVVSLTEPNVLLLSLDQLTDATCKTSTDGIISLLITGGIAPYKYLWNTGDTTINLINIPSNTYQLTATDSNGCKVQSTYSVTYNREKCEQDVFVPAGFSPDNDGINDGFVIDGVEKFPDNYLRIYNRWGTVVFEERGYKNTWKGTLETGANSSENIPLPSGTYFYVLELEVGAKAISGYVYISK